MLLGLFLVRFKKSFLFIPCGGLSWLHVSFFLHVKYTISYHIILLLLVDIIAAFRALRNTKGVQHVENTQDSV